MKKRQTIFIPQKILIIRLSSIGDIILTTPVIRLLKKKYPDSTIDFVIKKQFAELLINHPEIDNFFIFDSKKHPSNLRTIRQNIKQNNYDLIIDLHKNFRSYYLSLKSGAKKIVRYKKYIIARFLFVKFKKKIKKKFVPVYLRYLKSLTPFQIKYDNLGLDIFIDQKTKQRIGQKYQIFLTDSKSFILGIAPGASIASKRWGAEGFRTVVEHFIGQQKTKIILFGNSEDRKFIELMGIKNHPAVLNTAGELSILKAGALMDYCHVVLTNDSGLMHLSAALKKKTVAIFGSTTEELGFFPSMTKNVIIQNNELKCRPCSHVGRKKCPKSHFKCMNDISPQQVIAAVEQFLNNNIS